MKQILRTVTLSFLVALMPGWLMAQSALVISEPYAYPPIGKASTAIGFMKLSNPTDKDITILSASSPQVGMVELHNHVMDGDIMRMRKVDQVVVPAGETITLQPGGLHLMLMQSDDTVRQGTNIDVTLSFDDGQTHQFDMPVIERSSSNKAHHSE